MVNPLIAMRWTRYVPYAFSSALMGATYGVYQVNNSVAFAEDVEKRKKFMMWGNSSALPFGDGYSSQADILVRSPTLFPFFESRNDIKSVSFGPRSGCAITNSGELFIWGSVEEWTPEYGPEVVLNDGNPIPPFMRPRTRLPTRHVAPRRIMEKVAFAAFSESELLVVSDDAKSVLKLSVKTDDLITAMADGKDLPAFTKMELPKLGRNERIVQVCAGLDHFLLLTSEGRVFAAGDNHFGQCGRPWKKLNPEVDRISDFVEVRFPNNALTITQIAAGHNHNVALDKEGHVFTWGDDRKIQLTLGDTRSVKAGVMNNTQHMKWTEAIEKGIAMPATGLVAYGEYDLHAQFVPHETKEPPVPQGRPVKYPRADMVVAAANTTLTRHRDSPDWYPASLSTNVLFAAGENGMGQCGRSVKQQQTNMEVNTPARVYHEKVVCGANHCMALLGSGHVFGWGSNLHGALAAPSNKEARLIEDGSRPVSATTVAGGTVVCPPRHIPMPNERRVKRTDMTTFVGRASRLHTLEGQDKSSLNTAETGPVRDLFANWNASAAVVEVEPEDKVKTAPATFATPEEALKHGEEKIKPVEFVPLKRQ